MRPLVPLALALTLAGCGGGEPEPYQWGLPAGYPEPLVPADNPMSEAKVSLGRHLFYDRRLSVNGSQSCASCHRQELAFAEARPTAVGATGEAAPRNTLSLTNVAYNASYTWANPLLVRIEQQMLIPLFGEDPVELGLAGREAEVLAALGADADYRRLFAAAFPGEDDPFTFQNVVAAIASFVRSLISLDTRYDRYAYGGDDAALSASELRGLELFHSERLECHHCHGGFNFTQSTTHDRMAVAAEPFHNTGLYDVDGRGAYPAADRGLIDVTERPADMGKFRAPTLRNIAVTAPYMHDGSVPTLAAVIDLYAAGGHPSRHRDPFVRGFAISEEEKRDLLAFLHALTDERFLADPRHSDPFAADSGR